MMEPHQRLQQARKDAGYDTAADAAKAFGWVPSTYTSHENGTRGLRPGAAKRYAKAFRKPEEWLLLGKGKKAAQPAEQPKTVPLVGYVGAGSETYFFGEQSEHDKIAAPEGAGEETVAVEVRGESLGPLFDRWLAFYDDVHRPVSADQLGKLCVVGLPDGRILVKKVQRSRVPGRFHLLSNTEGPIMDVEIDWAARVINMVPR